MAEETGSAELTGLRQSIDNIDAALVHLLAERFKFTQQVGRLKAATGMAASDPEREKVQIARLRALAEESHLDPAFAEKFLNFIVAEVIHHHQSIASTGAIATTDLINDLPDGLSSDTDPIDA
ncbi:chorismate mutase [Conyzicola sp.]|uniref:chorismate mutase n=1 Tax=Conyzicola sp. TaxID=1969404 RepID=UPI003989CF54